ncbi:MAG: hypothetical protein KTR35_08675 [Gammaproteobacteria bacterium]|nr:hypothetical protein [Gammaproteobacteria bacterium]
MPLPPANLILMLLIGIVFGGIAAVVLRGKRSVFIINILLGVIGASLGAFFPVILGQAAIVDVSTPDYLLRSLMGAFLLVLVASLFRSAKPHGS